MSEQFTESELWGLWRNGKSAMARAVLITKHKALVEQLANKILHRLGMPADIDKRELISLGMIGLIQCVDKFVPELEVPFDAYARLRIKGAMLDGLKHHSELRAQLHFERQKKLQRIQSIQEESPNSGFERLATVAVGLAIGFMLEDTAMFQQEHPKPSAYDEQSEILVLREQLSREVFRLPKQEKKILVMHYFQGLHFSEIARLIGLSRARISQVHKQALQNLREAFHRNRKIDISG